MAFEDKVTAKGIGLYDEVGDGGSPLDTTNSKGKFWKVLRQQNACYDDLKLTKEALLYEGGFQMNTKEVAALFCPKMKDDEDDSQFKRRIESAAYTPTFTKLITGLISNLYSQDLEVMENADHDDGSTAGEELTGELRDFYKLFSADVDGNGTPLHNFFRDRTTRALIHQTCYFGVDYPKQEKQPESLKEQEDSGLDKPRLYTIDGTTVYDWKLVGGSQHCFEWLKLVSTVHYQPTPFDRPLMRIEIKTWKMGSEFAEYQTYLTRPVSKVEDLKEKEVIPMVDEGQTSFREIPIFRFYLDDGIAVGAKLAPMAAELFNRTTIENHSTNIGCVTIPVLYRGNMLPGDGSIPNPTMLNLQRGNHPKANVNSKGILELGSYSEDKFDIVESAAAALAFIHQQNEDLDEKMHSVIHQMGQSLKAQKQKGGKSGLSKQEDRRSMEMLLSAIADEVYEQVKHVFEVVSESRGEDIKWDIKGLSAVAQEDRDELVQEVLASQNVNVPSVTFQKEYAYRLASRLIEGTDQTTLQTIRKELEEGIDQKWASNMDQSQINNDPNHPANPNSTENPANQPKAPPAIKK